MTVEYVIHITSTNTGADDLVQEWFGISREGRFPIAVVVPHDDQSEEPVRADTLVSCNDDFGMDFHQIATAIREAF